MKGPRVGDKGTEIILRIKEKESLVNLTGVLGAVVIDGPNGLNSFPATVDANNHHISYIGSTTETLWPVKGLYRIRGKIEFIDGRIFTTEDVQVTVE